MEQQKKDEKRGITYKSGISLDCDTILDYIKEAKKRRRH